MILMVCMGMICIFCAGLCLSTLPYRLGREEKPGLLRRPGIHPKTDGEAERQFRIRQKQMQNFFNYSGDNLPSAEKTQERP